MRKLITRWKIVFASVAAFLGFGVFLAGPAGASPPADPTDGAMTTIQTDVTDWVTTYGLPALVALLGLGLIIGVLVRFARKGAAKVSG